jgi:hypothetical protein
VSRRLQGRFERWIRDCEATDGRALPHVALQPHRCGCCRSNRKPVRFLYYGGGRHAVAGTSIKPRCCAIGWKSLSLWSSGLRFSMHQVPIKRSMVLRTVTPRLRRERKLRAATTAIASPAIDTISKSLDFSGRPLASKALQHFAKHQIPNDDLVRSQPRAQAPNVRPIAAIEEVDPHAAVNDDHALARPLRLRARSPRQRYLPKAAPTSRCCRSLISKRSACSTVCFLVACPEAFCASAMSLSSISILVRIGVASFP